MSNLHSSIDVGPYEFAHRVVLAPLTRMRAEPATIDQIRKWAGELESKDLKNLSSR